MQEKEEIKIYDSKKVFDILKLIEKNPERYLSSKTITSLQDFINGYLTGHPYPDDSPPFWNFSHFLLNESKPKFKNEKLNQIARILLDKCNEDESKAFDKFFEYLEQYKNKK